MAKKHKFQAEVQKVLDLMIHSVYSNKEVFLRELISNASDALDKRRFLSLSDPNLSPKDNLFKIQITPDRNANILKIADNGIGMNEAEMIDNLGTIAKSGTKAFLEMLQQSQQNPELIGQFGVGFYSSFMVADKVQVLSKKAGEEQAHLWTSIGDGTYEIQKAEKAEAGTEISLYLKENENPEENFSEEWHIKSLIKKYSDFITYPIEVLCEKYEYDKDGKIIEGKTSKTWEQANSQKALWLRSASEIKAEEYNEFYKQNFSDWNDPLKVVHFKAEGSMEFSSLLFFPSKRPFNFNTVDAKKGLSLYVKKVFIMNYCEDLMPDYLRFVKGLVDSSDLSLNISREILQQNQQVAAIRKNLVTKTLKTLNEMMTKERESYEVLWKNFGSILKEGIPSDTNNTEKIAEVLLFHSTEQEGLSNLDEYISRMKDGQKDIYFLTGESLEQLKNSPHLEAVKDKGFEVLLLNDDIDEWVVSHLTKYKEKDLKSIAKGNLDLNTEEENKKLAEEESKYKEEMKDILETMKETLKEEVKEVRISKRLKDSPVVLVNDEEEMSANMARIIAAHKGETYKVKRILEINPKHSIFAKMKLAKPEEKKDWAELFYGQALLTEGLQLPDPVGFSKKMNKLMLS